MMFSSLSPAPESVHPRRQDWPSNTPELVHHILRYTLSALLATDRVGKDDLVDQLAHRLLEAPVGLIVVRTRKAGPEPRGLRVRNLRIFVGGKRLDQLLLAADCANLQASVLWAVEHLLPVQAKERLCGIFTSYFFFHMSAQCIEEERRSHRLSLRAARLRLRGASWRTWTRRTLASQRLSTEAVLA